jgi:hypothetical protein
MAEMACLLGFFGGLGGEKFCGFPRRSVGTKESVLTLECGNREIELVNTFQNFHGCPPWFRYSRFGKFDNLT